MGGNTGYGPPLSGTSLKAMCVDVLDIVNPSGSDSSGTDSTVETSGIGL